MTRAHPRTKAERAAETERERGEQAVVEAALKWHESLTPESRAELRAVARDLRAYLAPKGAGISSVEDPLGTGAFTLRTVELLDAVEKLAPIGAMGNKKEDVDG
jgi:hypothetical protein